MPVAQLGFVLVTIFCIWGKPYHKRVAFSVDLAGVVFQVKSRPSPLHKVWSLALKTVTTKVLIGNTIWAPAPVQSQLYTNLQRILCMCRTCMGLQPHSARSLWYPGGSWWHWEEKTMGVNPKEHWDDPGGSQPRFQRKCPVFPWMGSQQS